MWTDRVMAQVGLKQELSPKPFALDDITIHGDTEVRGSRHLDVTTPAAQWAFAVTFPLRRNAIDVRKIDSPLLIRIEAAVVTGKVGVGCVTPDLLSYISAEVDRTSEDEAEFDILVEPVGDQSCGCLVFRNVSESGQPSRVIVRSIRTYEVDRPRLPNLIEVEAPEIENRSAQDGVSAQTAETGTSLVHQKEFLAVTAPRRQSEAQHFQVLLSHTSRPWELMKCTREALIQRYAAPERLANLPRFQDLLSHRNRQLYGGGLTILDLAVGTNWVSLTARRCIDSRFKIQHASFVGECLVVCFEDFLLLVPNLEDSVMELDLRPGSPLRIDDNWFGGLHTVFPVDDNICLVSSSGSDAVLWVDIRRRRVIQRWRLPAETYGVNYELTPEMSVVDHYIYNDIQLGHLNCAYPDGRQGCFVSTLIQGDIGHFDQHGNYSLLERGHVGCHGVRLSQDGRDVYFTDSCGGRMMRIEPGAGAVEVRRVDSRWLHDVEQVDSDLYWFCLGDKNEVALIDLTRDRELGRFPFDSRGTNVQFVTTVRNR